MLAVLHLTGLLGGMLIVLTNSMLHKLAKRRKRLKQLRQDLQDGYLLVKERRVKELKIRSLEIEIDLIETHEIDPDSLWEEI